MDVQYSNTEVIGLNRRAALIIGVTSQIGDAIAQNLVENGWEVFGVSRSGRRTQAELVSHDTLEDICDENLVSSFLLEKVDFFKENEFKRVGLVYAAAHFSRRETLKELNLSEFRSTLDINLIGAFVWSRALIKLTLDERFICKIVNISSQAWKSGGYGGVVHYASSKGGLISMTRALAREFSKSNVRINSLVPGFVDTTSMRSNLDSERIAFFEQLTSLGRFATTQEIAASCRFLLEEDSDYLTGVALDATGGHLMY